LTVETGGKLREAISEDAQVERSRAVKGVEEVGEFGGEDEDAEERRRTASERVRLLVGGRRRRRRVRRSDGKTEGV
jgi:hypothetical protein